jgi:hypothetical protein
VPHGDSPNDLVPVLPVFLSYVLSFVYVGIYWNNHHHLLHAAITVTAAILWANLHMLSLFPFATGWMGENYFSALPTALYGVVLPKPRTPGLRCQSRWQRGGPPGSGVFSPTRLTSESRRLFISILPYSGTADCRRTFARSWLDQSSSWAAERSYVSPRCRHPV